MAGENENAIRYRFSRSISQGNFDTTNEKSGQKPKPKLPDYNRSKTKICHQGRTSLLSSGNNWEDFTGQGLIQKIKI